MSAPRHIRHDSQARERFAGACGANPAHFPEGSSPGDVNETKDRENAGPPMPEFQAGVARVTGLEPATSGVTGRHSNQLSYTRIPLSCAPWR